MRSTGRLVRPCWPSAARSADARRGDAKITGVYGYPVGLAAGVAVDSVRRAPRSESAFEQVIFCCFSRRDFEVYDRLLA
ncbi:MAG TPA: hypothetical protein VGK32_20860 [Vicinamibacterales bacterium]